MPAPRERRSRTPAVTAARRFRLRPIAALALVSGIAVAAPTERLAPTGMRVVRGDVGPQGVAALAASTRTGQNDAWDDYLEFRPGRRGFVATSDDWVDALGRVRLRWSTPRDGDASQLDELVLSARGAEPEGPSGPREPAASGGPWSPAPGTSWQWQLTGAIDTSFDVDMYDIDLFTTARSTIDALHADGRAVICYFSAGSSEDWRPDDAAFPPVVKGRSNGWDGERWLDVRRLDILGPLMRARLDLAVAKGCDGVEPDNVDGYASGNDTGFALTASDQLGYNVWLATEAHARGLSIGLKNDLDQIVELEPHFDWALNEQCAEFGECAELSPFVAAGKAVFGVEYEGDPGRFCSVVNALDFDWLRKDLALGPHREACR